jgi:Carboxypeptidase regulatory-like domain
MRNGWLRGVTLAAALLLTCGLRQGACQSDTTSVSGSVKDSSGAVVANASVIVTNEATGVKRGAQTNAAGNFVVNALLPGLYMVSIEVPGFKRFEEVHRKLDPNVPATVAVSLQVGAQAESVTVTAAAANLQVDSATVGKLVEGKQVSDLQLNGRNPLMLAALMPGVSGGSLAGLNYAVNSGGFSINGSRTFDYLITFDGAVGVRTRANGTAIGAADVEATQEIQVLTANYSAEYGRSNGGQIRIVTKSGTRDLHATAYEYLRNSALNSNTWTRNLSKSTNFQAPERYNQFGFNIGGPVYLPKILPTREKVFFMVSEEWLVRRLASTATATVPTDAMRAGDFSSLLTANAFYSGSRIIKDPTNGSPFAGNIIPKSQISPNGAALLRVYPEPTPGFLSGSKNWIGAAASPFDQRKDTVNVDVIPAAKHALHVRLRNYAYADSAPFGTNFDLYPVVKHRPEQSGSIGWTYTPAPTLVNETFFTFSHDRLTTDIGLDSGRWDRTNYGINFPYAFPGQKDIPNKIPSVDIPSFTSYTGTPYPSFFAGPVYNWANNTTKVKGNHTIKFGVLFERAGENDKDQIDFFNPPGGADNQNGKFGFSDTRTGGSSLGLADAILGLYNTYGEVGLRSYTPYRGSMFEWFIQDNWKATQRLKVEIGLRQSIIQPYYSVWRNIASFDPAFYDPAKAVKVDAKGNPIPGSGDPYDGMVIPGDGWPDAAKGRVAIASDRSYDRLFHGLGKSYSDIHYRDFQPRLGLAYMLNNKTVLRAGGGSFVDRLGVSDSVHLGGNAPLQGAASFALGNVDNPAGSSGLGYPIFATSQDRKFENPLAYTWSTTVQRELSSNTSIEVGYVGRRGLRLQRELNINQLAAGTLFQPQYTGVNPNQLRPYAGYGPIRQTQNTGRSMYNSLQLQVNRRFSNGLGFGGAYTLARSMDNGSSYTYLMPNAYNDRIVWGPSDFDARHTVVLNAMYELPFLKKNNALAGKMLGGWQITTVTQFQTGLPITIATADDFAGVGTGSGNQIWNMAVAPHTPHQFSPSANSGNYWFVPTANGAPIFTAPANGTFTMQNNRGALRNPGYQNWNLGLFKKFTITERQALTFRAEGFNFINHSNLSGVGTNPRAATFGMVTSKSGERDIQLSLRYSF